MTTTVWLLIVTLGGSNVPRTAVLVSEHESEAACATAGAMARTAKRNAKISVEGWICIEQPARLER